MNYVDWFFNAVKVSPLEFYSKMDIVPPVLVGLPVPTNSKTDYDKRLFLARTKSNMTKDWQDTVPDTALGYAFITILINYWNGFQYIVVSLGYFRAVDILWGSGTSGIFYSMVYIVVSLGHFWYIYSMVLTVNFLSGAEFAVKLAADPKSFILIL